MKAQETGDFSLEEAVTIFSNEDSNLKILGELLGNESSRAMLILLTQNEMTASELAQKIGIGLYVTIHHLNKMQQIDIVKVNRVTKNTKNHDMKFYIAKRGILILGIEVVSRAKGSKMFANSLKRILRFAVIGIAGVTSWIISQISQGARVGQIIGGRGDVPTPIMDSLFVPIVVVILALGIERLLSYYKKKK